MINEITITKKTMTLKDITDLIDCRHNDAMGIVAKMSESPDFGSVTKSSYRTKMGNNYETYALNKRQSIAVAAKLNTPMLMRVIDRWQELEEKQTQLIPDFSDPAEAAIAWAEQYRLAQSAIATKAEIGSRREATAMNTASQAVIKANKLEVELDKSKSHATIKRMEMLHHGVKFNWRLLKSACSDLGVESVDIFDANYGTVKAYPAEAWAEAYALSIEG